MAYLVLLDDPIDVDAAVRALRTECGDISDGLGGVDIGISITLGLSTGVAYLTFLSDGEAVFVDCAREPAAEFMEWFLLRVVGAGSVTVTDDLYSFDERIAAPSGLEVILDLLPR